MAPPRGGRRRRSFRPAGPPAPALARRGRVGRAVRAGPAPAPDATAAERSAVANYGHPADRGCPGAGQCPRACRVAAGWPPGGAQRVVGCRLVATVNRELDPRGGLPCGRQPWLPGRGSGCRERRSRCGSRRPERRRPPETGRAGGGYEPPAAAAGRGRDGARGSRQDPPSSTPCASPRSLPVKPGASRSISAPIRSSTTDGTITFLDTRRVTRRSRRCARAAPPLPTWRSWSWPPTTGVQPADRGSDFATSGLPKTPLPHRHEQD